MIRENDGKVVNNQVHNTTMQDELSARFAKYRKLNEVGAAPQRQEVVESAAPQLKETATIPPTTVDDGITFEELSNLLELLIKFKIISDKDRRNINELNSLHKRINFMRACLQKQDADLLLLNNRLSDEDFERMAQEAQKERKAKEAENGNKAIADIVDKMVRENKQIKHHLETTVKKSYEDEMEATKKYNVQVMQTLKESQESYKLLDAQHKKLSEEYEKLRAELQDTKKKLDERPTAIDAGTKNNRMRGVKLDRYINEIMSQQYSPEKKQFLLNCMDAGMPYRLVKKLSKQEITQVEMDMLLKYAHKTY